MSPFKGFGDSALSKGILLPELFFTEALPLVDSLEELKLCLLSFRLLSRQNSSDPYLTEEIVLQEIIEEKQGLTPEQVKLALEQACAHGILVMTQYRQASLYFLNTPRSRSIIRANEKGAWRPENAAPAVVQVERPNLFTLYEQNIGPLTPILAQTLEEAENTYPSEWIDDAIKIAVKRNVRNWNFVEAILRSWKEKGRNEEDRRNSQENPRNYIEGDLANYIKH